MKKRSFTYLITLFIACLSISGCDSNDDELFDAGLPGDATRIWTAFPNLLVGDGKIALEWMIPNSLEICCEEPYANPTSFEIYMSKKLNGDYTKVGFVNTINDGIFGYDVKSLTNGQSYYFYVKAFRDDFETTISDTVTSLPNKLPNPSVVFSGKSEFAQSALSPGVDKIAYVDHYYSWFDQYERMASTLFISDMKGENEIKVDISSYYPCWSPDGEKLVFHTEKGEINTGFGFPSHIAVYDCRTKSIVRLTSGNMSNYCPSYNKTGNKILYRSIDNQSGEVCFKIFDFQTMEHKTIVNLKANNIYMGYYEWANWMDDDRVVFSAMDKNYVYNIYICSIVDGSIKLLIDSPYKDAYPFISPDKEQILFVSDRSGSDQLWIYNLNSGKRKQLTAFSFRSENYLSNGGVGMGWINNDTIYYSLGSNKVVKLRIS